MRLCQVCLAQLPQVMRSDVKVCGPRCRKRLQRAKERLAQDYPHLSDSPQALKAQLVIEGWAGNRQYYLEAGEWP